MSLTNGYFSIQIKYFCLNIAWQFYYNSFESQQKCVAQSLWCIRMTKMLFRIMHQTKNEANSRALASANFLISFIPSLAYKLL